MRHFKLFSLVLLAWVFVAKGQHPDAGTTIFPFVNIDYDASSVAMAGASVGMPGGNGNNHIFANPASAAVVERYQVLIGYRKIVDDILGVPLVASRSFGKYGVFSLLMYGVSSGDVDVVLEVNGEPYYTGQTARVQSISGGGSWAYQYLENLYLGVSLRGIYDVIKVPGTNYSATAGVVDIGAQYNLWRERFVAGVAVRNLGFLVSSYDDLKYDLPLTLEIGASYVPIHLEKVRIALDINKCKNDYLNFEPGLEISIYQEYLKARVGYVFSWRDLQEAFKSFSGEQDDNYTKSNYNSFSFGVGLNTNIKKTNVQIDFALQFHTSSLPVSSVVSATLDF